MSTTGSTGTPRTSRRVPLAALLIALAGCSGAFAPSRSAYTPSLADARTRTTTILRVFIPAHQRRPKLQWLSLSKRFDGSSLAAFYLKPGGNCRTVTGTLECTAPVRLSPGTHGLFVATHSFGNPQSESENDLFVTIEACKPNSIDLAMYEKKASQIALVSEDPNVERRPGGYFGPFGSGTFNVAPLDERGYTIVGPGAPLIRVESSHPKVVAIFSGTANDLGLALAQPEPFDKRFGSRITLTDGALQRHFEFTTEFTTWPTVTPSPAPAPC